MTSVETFIEDAFIFCRNFLYTLFYGVFRPISLYRNFKENEGKLIKAIPFFIVCMIVSAILDYSAPNFQFIKTTQGIFVPLYNNFENLTFLQKILLGIPGIIIGFLMIKVVSLALYRQMPDGGLYGFYIISSYYIFYTAASTMLNLNEGYLALARMNDFVIGATIITFGLVDELLIRRFTRHDIRIKPFFFVLTNSVAIHNLTSLRRWQFIKRGQ